MHTVALPSGPRLCDLTTPKGQKRLNVQTGSGEVAINLCYGATNGFERGKLGRVQEGGAGVQWSPLRTHPLLARRVASLTCVAPLAPS